MIRQTQSVKSGSRVGRVRNGERVGRITGKKETCNSTFAIIYLYYMMILISTLYDDLFSQQVPEYEYRGMCIRRWLLKRSEKVARYA